MKLYLVAMRRYAVFRGRASRSEFWWFALVYIVGAIVVVVIDQTLFVAEVEPGSGVLTAIYALAHLVPGMAVLVRRLHDIDRTGWWVLINAVPFATFVLLAFAATRGTPGPNRYGPQPDHSSASSRASDMAR